MLNECVWDKSSINSCKLIESHSRYFTLIVFCENSKNFKDFDLRLFDSNSRHLYLNEKNLKYSFSGILQVFFKNIWYHFSSFLMKKREVDLVCKTFGYSSGTLLAAREENIYSFSISLYDYNCSRLANKLNDCSKIMKHIENYQYLNNYDKFGQSGMFVIFLLM